MLFLHIRKKNVQFFMLFNFPYSYLIDLAGWIWDTR